jgi:hypothetical protein
MGLNPSRMRVGPVIRPRLDHVDPCKLMCRLLYVFHPYINFVSSNARAYLPSYHKKKSKSYASKILYCKRDIVRNKRTGEVVGCTGSADVPGAVIDPWRHGASVPFRHSIDPDLFPCIQVCVKLPRHRHSCAHVISIPCLLHHIRVRLTETSMF